MFIRLLLTIIFTLFITSCGTEDDSTEAPSVNPSDDLEYTSETLTGKIGGEEWTFATGTLKDVFDDGTYWIDLYSNEIEDPCTNGSFEGSTEKILFSHPTTLAEDEEVTLSFSFGSEENQTVTLYDGETNNIATVGKYRITNIDDLTYEMVVEIDDENYVNGVFTLTNCLKEEEE